jgi:hypothetical protein
MCHPGQRGPKAIKFCILNNFEEGSPLGILGISIKGLAFITARKDQLTSRVAKE